MRNLVHPAYPVVGVPPHGHDQGVLNVQTRGAQLAFPARPLACLDTFVDTILKPVLCQEKQEKIQMKQNGAGRTNAEKKQNKKNGTMKTRVKITVVTVTPVFLIPANVRRVSRAYIRRFEQGMLLIGDTRGWLS